MQLDAHADVKELIDGKSHSGSPFREALTHSTHPAAKYVLAGLLRHNISEENFSFFNRVERNFLGEESNITTPQQAYNAIETNYMVCFDLDALDSAIAPGVSALSHHAGDSSHEPGFMLQD